MLPDIDTFPYKRNCPKRAATCGTKSDAKVNSSPVQYSAEDLHATSLSTLTQIHLIRALYWADHLRANADRQNRANSGQYMRYRLIWTSIYILCRSVGLSKFKSLLHNFCVACVDTKVSCCARCRAHRARAAAPSVRFHFATAAAVIPPVRDYVATSVQHASLAR